MFGFDRGVAIMVENTPLEKAHNKRIFEVLVSRKGDYLFQGDGLKFTVRANSFVQASEAAVKQANLWRDLYLAQNTGDESEKKAGRFFPADIREMTVKHSNVVDFRHEE